MGKHEQILQTVKKVQTKQNQTIRLFLLLCVLLLVLYNRLWLFSVVNSTLFLSTQKNTKTLTTTTEPPPSLDPPQFCSKSNYLLDADHRKTDLKDVPITALEFHPITAEHNRIKVTCTQLTPSHEEDQQYAIKTSQPTSEVTTLWDKQIYHSIEVLLLTVNIWKSYVNCRQRNEYRSDHHSNEHYLSNSEDKA